MPQYDYEDDNDFETTTNESDLIKDLRRQLKNAAKERDDWKTKFESESKAATEFRLRDVLSARGVTDKRAARFMKADGIDLSDEKAVDTWLNDNGDMFGYAPEAKDERTEEVRQGTERMNATESGGTKQSSQDQILAEIAGAQSPEELDRIRAKYAHIKLS